MSADIPSARAERLRTFSRGVGILVMAEGIAVLAAWAFDVDMVKSVIDGLPPMKPNTALAFIPLGWALQQHAGRSGSSKARRWADVCALLVAFMGLLTLIQHVTGADFGIDRLLFSASVLAEPWPHPGRMAFATAFCLLLFGLAMPLVRHDGRARVVGEAFAVSTALMSVVAFTGYVYGVDSLYRVGGRAAMAVHTAVTLLFLSCGLAAAHPERGLVAIIISKGPGGRAARRLLPFSIIFTFVVGWLGVLGQRAELYDADFGVSIRALVVIGTFSAVILWNARSLDKLDRERRMAEDSTREKGHLLQVILDSMSDGVAVADVRGRFLHFNRAAEEILGVGPTNAGPEGWADSYGLFVDETPTRFPSMELPLARAIRGEEVTNVEMVTRNPRRPEGAWLRVSARPLQDPQGVHQGAIALFSDVTEGRRLEEARHRALEMEAASRRSEEASRLKSEFLANMSHELRTPLNAVIGFAEILHDAKVGPVNTDQKEFLGDILTSSRHLLQLINDVLDLSKIEAGKMEFRPESVDMTRLVAEVRGVLGSIAAAKRIRMETQIDDRLGTVVVDPGRLKQILYNYLSNALKFTPEEGRVTVRVAPEGPDQFRVEVEDTGIGIRTEDLDRLFIAFQQLDASTTKKYAGTGLGLALTRRLVEAQQGSAGVRSTPDRGSVFHATLPRVARTTETPGRSAPAAGRP